MRLFEFAGEFVFLNDFELKTIDAALGVLGA